jgi:serine/threonine-protein kinase
VKEGYVIGTDPGAGENLDVRSTVYVMVSTGPEAKQVSMPNLVGRTVADAEAKLAAAGLQLGSVSYVEKAYDDSTMYGLVIWQSVDANTKVNSGTKVYIQVSKKPADAGTAG